MNSSTPLTTSSILHGLHPAEDNRSRGCFSRPRLTYHIITEPEQDVCPSTSSSRTSASLAIDDHSSSLSQKKASPPTTPTPALIGINGGRWTKQEHENFLIGLQMYGREWKKVASKIKTRTSAQIRSHAQKYFAKRHGPKHQLDMAAIRSDAKRFFKGASSSSSSREEEEEEEEQEEEYPRALRKTKTNQGHNASPSASSTCSSSQGSGSVYETEDCSMMPHRLVEDPPKPRNPPLPSPTTLMASLSPTTRKRVSTLEDDELSAIQVLATSAFRRVSKRNRRSV